jgi:uncharacterized membrane protein YfcA
MIALCLFAASFVAWFLSMLAGGGSPFILIPLISLWIGVQAVAPVITTGLLVGNSQRSLFFWSHINWTVTAWYIPGATVGAIIGCYGLSHIHAEGFQGLIGIGLVIMAISYGLGRKEVHVPIKAWTFLPVALINAVGSGLIGSTGPIMNPMYLNYGLEKEAMIATKALNKAVLHIIKLTAYLFLGNLSLEYLAYGLVIGLAAVPANLLGKQVLAQISAQQFRHLVFTFVAVSGIVMVWQQRASLLLMVVPPQAF